MKVYDGNGMVLGRLAARVAKDALLGEVVKVVNCEKVIVSGNKTFTFEHEKQRRKRKGYPLKSAKLPRLADKIVRRSIRGMLPWKLARGKEAFRRINCHVGVPEDLSGKMIRLKDSSLEKLPNLKYVTVGEICKNLGGKE